MCALVTRLIRVTLTCTFLDVIVTIAFGLVTQLSLSDLYTLVATLKVPVIIC